MKETCDTCLHKKICDLWSSHECQDAACYTDDCYTPAADVAPLTRCADCKYYDKRGAPGGLGWCARPGAGCGIAEDFFCAGGEREEADDGSADG